MIGNLLAWLIIGLIAGWLASMIMGRGGYGIVGDIIVGIIGAIIGGWLASALFGADVNLFSIPGLIVAIVGAIILIALLRALSGGRARV